jgi:hypothetical protein
VTFSCPAGVSWAVLGSDLAPAGLDDVTALLQAISDGEFDRTIPAQVPSGLSVGGLL